LTTTDSYSRFLINCNGLLNTKTRGVYPIVKAAFLEYGLPDAIRTDNGAPFASKAPQGLSRLSIWWLKLGIRHERIEPGHPEQNGRHERMHRTLKDETTKPSANTLRSQQQRFNAFRYEYNHERPHEALGQTPPALHYGASSKAYPTRIRAFEYPEGSEIRQVHQSGRIRWNGHLIHIALPLGGEKIALLKTSDGFWNVLFGPLTLGILDQNRLDLGLIRVN
jgi:putative transposase